MVKQSRSVQELFGAIRMEFRALVYQDEDLWVAHCLECDVASQGHSSDEAISELRDALGSLIEYAMKEGDLRPLYLPAPLDLWMRFADLSVKGTRGRKKDRDHFELRTELVPSG